MFVPAGAVVRPTRAMSGVMLKVAIYGILRFGFDLLAPVAGPLPSSWGWIVLATGTVSAVLGVLYALQQHDLKRLLAFHSVENIGIILIGVGLAMILWRQEGTSGALAAVALTAALLHTVNHAAFKGLLFLGAGSVLARTHVRNIEELGGLARRMPWTAGLFLLGAVAISALPPLNGFVSEWLTFQALLGGASRFAGPAGLVIVLSAAMLALTGGLAAACFAKAFGVTFFGRPRTPHAEQATEAPPTMIAAMAWLGALCVALGVAPGYAMRLLDAPTAELLDGVTASAVVTARGPLVLSTALMPPGTNATAISMTMVAALLVALTAMAWVLRRGVRRAVPRTAPTWTCGMSPTPRFDYTATAFAKPLRLVFEALYHPRRGDPRDRRDAVRRPAHPLRRRSRGPRGDADLPPRRAGDLGALAGDSRPQHRQHLRVHRVRARNPLRGAAAGRGDLRMTGDRPLELVALEMFLLVLLGPLVTGLIQKMKARLQCRQGAAILQPYRDLAKLFHKGTVQADTASGFFRSIPVLVLAATVTAGALVPVVRMGPPAFPLGDAVMLLGLFALARFLTAIGALDAGGAFGGMGASREMTVAPLVEPVLMMVVFSTARSG